jgi:putative ABC transport system permease protein
MTLLRLAFSNVRKSFRDFTVYFLTLTLGVSIFYIFNSLESQQAVMALTSSQSTALKSLDAIMSNFSFLVAVILGFLIIYANRYLIKRRKQEFGIYMTLGMERSRISWILVLETIFVGLMALVAGSILGILLSQGMAVLTAKLLGAEVASFQFVFSLEALKDSAVYFGLTFLLVMIFNVVMVRRQKLIDLIYAARRNEKFKPLRLGLSVVIFLAALGCLAAAYILISDTGLLILPYLWSALALGVVGTFLFFFSLSGFFLKLLQKIKSVYFKGLNMFVMRQINSKIHTAYVSLTLVCLMLFASICTLSSGMGLAKAVTDDVQRSTPFDASLIVSADYDFDNGELGKYPADGVDLLAIVRQNGVDMGSFARDYAAIRYYGGAVEALELKDMSVLDGEGSRRVGLNYAKLSEYNRVLALQGAPPLELAAGQYGVDMAKAEDKMVGLVGPQIVGQVLTVGGAPLATSTNKLSAHTLAVGGSSSELVVVVPDELLASAPAKRDLLHVQYRDHQPATEALAVQSLTGPGGVGLDNQLNTKVMRVENSSSNTTTIAYLAVYLGIVFLVASAAVLSIIQLSEASDNARRYKLLHKIGTDERLINSAILRQTAIFFGAPLLLALVHSVVGIGVVTHIIKSFNDTDILSSSLIAALIILVIYGGYFWATYHGSKNVISREYARQDKAN